MEINPNIFRAYDIRGKYPDEINEITVYKIGQAFAKYTKAKKILVGRDARLSSKSLSASLIKGINSQEVSVLDIGLCSEPVFYSAVAESDVDGGLMSTASHLGKGFNGLKPVFRKAVPLAREEVAELKNLVINSEFEVISNTRAAAKGVKEDLSSLTEEKIIKQDFTQTYINEIRKFIKTKFKPFKIVIDASNGMAGLYVEKVFAGTDLKIVPIFVEIDGNFPNHDPDPKILVNRQKLIDKIIAEKADLGIMLDGDADRVYFLDRQGEVIDPSLVSALIAQYLIEQSRKKKVLVEVRTSWAVKDFVEKIGGKVEVSLCWTIPIKLKMRQDHEIIFGSETSGHYVFADFYWTDDGILAALNFLQAISAKKEESIDEILSDFRGKYFIIEETNFEIENPGQASEVLKILEQNYKKQGAKIIKIDGLTVQFPNWWFNLRPSETEPLIRLNLEAKTKELMEEKKKEVSSLITRTAAKGGEERMFFDSLPTEA